MLFPFSFSNLQYYLHQLNYARTYRRIIAPLD